MRKAAVALAAALALGAISAGPAAADQPRPGSTQCVPGQNGNPPPGFKAGVCSNK